MARQEHKLNAIYRIPLLGFVLRLIRFMGRFPRLFIDMQKRLASIEEGLNHHMPILLNTISSFSGSARSLQRNLSQMKSDAEERSRRIEALEITIDKHIEEQIQQRDLLEERLRASEDRLATQSQLLEKHLCTYGDLTAVINRSIESLESNYGNLKTHEIPEIRKTLSYLVERVEFVRRETLYELKYGKIRSKKRKGEQKPTIVNTEKVMNSPEIRVNIGCGLLPVNGYINVDRRDLPKVDIIAEANDLPFEKGTVDEIFSSHLIEHFPQEQLRREILPYWYTLLKHNGALRAVLPDAEKMMSTYAKGEILFDDLREVTFGTQDYDGDFHYNMFTRESLTALLKESKFKDIHFPVVGRRNGKSYEMEVRATK